MVEVHHDRTDVVSAARCCVVVLGMHRSGTSAFARLLGFLGCDLPKTLLKASKTNPTGYWESEPINRLNDRILDSAGSSWHDCLEFNPAWLDTLKAEQFRKEAIATIEAEYGESCLFVLKDPRICRITPFWLNVLNDAGIGVKVILPIRNPLDVAASLERRDGNTHPGASLLLWLRNVLEAEHGSRDVARVFASYDELIDQWAAVVEHMQSALGVTWPQDSLHGRGAISAFLSKGHRHHHKAPEAVIENPSIASWIRDAYLILNRWATDGEIRDERRALDRIRQEFNLAAPAFAGIVEAGRVARATVLRQQGELAATEKALAAERQKIRDIERQRRAAVDEVERAVRTLTGEGRRSFLPRRLRLASRIARLKRSNLFDAKWYLQQYPDVAQARTNPFRHFIRYGLSEGRSANPAQALAKGDAVVGHYKRWIEYHDTLTQSDVEEMRQRLAECAQLPLISVVMPVYNTPETFLREAIESVRRQIYEHWELCVADDCSTKQYVHKILHEYAALDQRVRIVSRSVNGHIAACSNSAAEVASGEWIVLLDHDDLLSPRALAEVALASIAHPDAQMIYSDEDKLDQNGQRKEPYFKPDWNYFLFLSQNMLSHLGAYRTSLLREAGGFRTGFEGSQDYDLALRCLEKTDPSQIIHIPKVLYHWRQLPGSTSVSADQKPYAMLAGERALNEHFERTGKSARSELIGHGYRTHWQLPDPSPSVTIIIPNKDNVGLLRTCIDSILSKSSYKKYSIIIVDNASKPTETKKYYDSIRHKGVDIVSYAERFNLSAMCNMGVANATSDYVVLLHNDTEVISAGWIEEMLGIAIQERVGAVGARLWYADDTLQHAGLVLSPAHIAMNAHEFLPKGRKGYFGRAALTHECSAVTAACLMISKKRYEQVGGMNEADLPVAYNDVDLCLRLKGIGYKNVCAAFAELYHKESGTRRIGDVHSEQNIKERSYMLKTWHSELQNDEMFNKNLANDRDDFAIAI